MFQATSFAHLAILAIALLLTIAMIAAVVVTLLDTSAGVGERVVWTIVLVAFPVVGLALWVITRAVRRQRKPGQTG